MLLLFLTALWDETYQGMGIHVRDDDIAWRWRLFILLYAVLYLVLYNRSNIAFHIGKRPVCYPFISHLSTLFPSTCDHLKAW